MTDDKLCPVIWTNMNPTGPPEIHALIIDSVDAVNGCYTCKNTYHDEARVTIPLSYTRPDQLVVNEAFYIKIRKINSP